MKESVALETSSISRCCSEISLQFPFLYPSKGKEGAGNLPWVPVHIPSDPTLIRNCFHHNECCDCGRTQLKRADWKDKSLCGNQTTLHIAAPWWTTGIPAEGSRGIPKGMHICSGITGPSFHFHFPVVLLSWLLFSHFITLHLISDCVITASIAITICAVIVFPSFLTSCCHLMFLQTY